MYITASGRTSLTQVIQLWDKQTQFIQMLAMIPGATLLRQSLFYCTNSFDSARMYKSNYIYYYYKLFQVSRLD